MIQVNPGECSLSTIELEQGQDSHLTSNQQFQTHFYFGVGFQTFQENLTKLHSGNSAFRENLTKLHNGTSFYHWNKVFLGLLFWGL